MLLSILMPVALGFTELPQQRLAQGSCAAFLWTRTEAPVRIAMIDESALTLRLARGKRILDIARTGPGTYAGHGMTVKLNLEFVERQGLSDGALIESGVMRFDIAGQDSVSIPVGGIRACR
ncbi:MAG: hypothetical protein KGZ61_04705 [Sandarakinorhabdus sp.]|nr:hypothetical protein [Sandarakinorhabdus sp.]